MNRSASGAGRIRVSVRAGWSHAYIHAALSAKGCGRGPETSGYAPPLPPRPKGRGGGERGADRVAAVPPLETGRGRGVRMQGAEWGRQTSGLRPPKATPQTGPYRAPVFRPDPRHIPPAASSTAGARSLTAFGMTRCGTGPPKGARGRQPRRRAWHHPYYLALKRRCALRRLAAELDSGGGKWYLFSPTPKGDPMDGVARRSEEELPCPCRE
jgi:hypothetical protein